MILNFYFLHLSFSVTTQRVLKCNFAGENSAECCSLWKPFFEGGGWGELNQIIWIYCVFHLAVCN